MTTNEPSAILAETRRNQHHVKGNPTARSGQWQVNKKAKSISNDCSFILVSSCPGLTRTTCGPRAGPTARLASPSSTPSVVCFLRILQPLDPQYIPVYPRLSTLALTICLVTLSGTLWSIRDRSTGQTDDQTIGRRNGRAVANITLGCYRELLKGRHWQPLTTRQQVSKGCTTAAEPAQTGIAAVKRFAQHHKPLN